MEVFFLFAIVKYQLTYVADVTLLSMTITYLTAYKLHPRPHAVCIVPHYAFIET
jgi:hypothetical protein